MNTKQASVSHFWTNITKFFSHFNASIDYTITQHVKDRILEENPELGQEEVERLTEKEIQEYIPEYFMYMHWPLM